MTDLPPLGLDVSKSKFNACLIREGIVARIAPDAIIRTSVQPPLPRNYTCEAS